MRNIEKNPIIAVKINYFKMEDIVFMAQSLQAKRKVW